MDGGLGLESRCAVTYGFSKRIKREGLGKAKHIEIQYLWLQEAIRRKRLVGLKVAGEANPSDLMTKHLCSERMRFLQNLMGHWYIEGRIGG